jgi:LTXXQ motif family protein
VRSALNSHAVAGALHNAGALRNPGTRAQVAATAATAGWHDGRGRGWWRHGHGGYGWVGPLFWPFAYYDMYDYAMWGYGDDPSFWDYGYNDIYAGVFAPYGYDDLSGYLPASRSGVGTPQASQASAAAHPAPDQLTQMCGDDSRDIAGLPIDRIQQAIAPNDAQRAALDDLANASVKAAEAIRAACPTQISLTAPARLAVMQQRVEAMIAAVGTVQPALDKFYGLLNDEQKARLDAIGQDQHGKSAAKKTGSPLAQNCGSAQSGVTDWPTAEINARLHPTDAQRASLTALQDASAKATDLLKSSCQPDDALTPSARLAAVGKRLDVMLQAVKTVRSALDDFYGKLTDEQKAQFEAIGPGRNATASSDSEAGTSTAAPSRHYRRHHAGINGILRHFMALMR